MVSCGFTRKFFLNMLLKQCKIKKNPCKKFTGIFFSSQNSFLTVLFIIFHFRLEQIAFISPFGIFLSGFE